MTEPVVPIAEVQIRQPCRVQGRVRSVRVRPWADSPTLEVVLMDGTGGIAVVFLARRRLGGVRPGTLMTVEGTVGVHGGRLTMLNPRYELSPAGADAGETPPPARRRGRRPRS
jgi:hypothetical protein